MRLDDVCSQDVVIDTNVLSHADNAGAEHQESALAVLEWMRGSAATWVLDDSGKNQPDPWTSVLYSEYHATLAPQGAALTLFMWCLATGRVDFAPRPARPVAVKIEQLVPRNKKDRVVLGAAHGSRSKVLISNDEADFSDDVRRSADKDLGVLVCCSHEVVA